MRITSQMMLSHYKNDVSDAFASMNKAMRHAYDYRSFDRPSDDPLAAAQTFNVHWQMSRNDDYTTNINNMQGIFGTADKILQNVDKLLSEADGTKTLQAVGPGMNGDSRKDLATELTGIRDNIIGQMNAKYGDSYVFGGSNNSNAPFQMDGDSLYYRGVNVDTGKMKDGSTPTVSLDDLAKESGGYVDIGLGLEMDGGKVNPQSAFDSFLPGISFLGYGTDSSGNPKNVCSMLTKIANTLKSSASEDKLSTSELNTIQGYISTYRDSHSGLVNGQTQVGIKVNSLEYASGYIGEMNLNLASKDNQVEYVDPSDAIEDYYQQMYCYNASLKVGGQILQQSLMDYLK